VIEGIVAILAGLLLIAPVIDRSMSGSRFIAALTPFSAVIGVVAVVLGVLNILSVIGLVLIVAGLVLAADALSKVPAIGDHLERAGNALRPFRIVLGIIVLVLGIVAILGALGGGPPPDAGPPPGRGRG
jgi:cadmium resistance protein CadD (predicted permease)